MGSIFRKLCSDNNITQTFTSPYNPQSNGIIARINSIITTTLKRCRGYRLASLPGQLHKRINLVVSRVGEISLFKHNLEIRPLIHCKRMKPGWFGRNKKKRIKFEKQTEIFTMLGELLFS